MPKLTKEIRKYIKDLAKNFPNQPLEKGATVRWRVSGAYLLDNTNHTTINGEPIQRDKFYLGGSDDSFHTVNHERRMRKAYEAGGFPELKKYVDKIKDYLVKNQTPDNKDSNDKG
jgi:hypothetical protein